MVRIHSPRPFYFFDSRRTACSGYHCIFGIHQSCELPLIFRLNIFLTAAGLFTSDESKVPLITVEELFELLSGDEPPVVLDVRSRSSYDSDGYRIPGDIRLLPDQVKEWGPQFDGSNMVVTYCS